MNPEEGWRTALQFLSHFKKYDYKAYVVGGAVRDYLLHRKIHDFDVVTEAKSEEIEALFPSAIQMSRHFPIFIIHWNRLSFEVTTFHYEAKDLRADLRLRDFTINAIAVDEKGHVIDPWQGNVDIRSQVIRAINPEERFYEDPLRMIRAVRFQAELGFTIERRTWEALVSAKAQLDGVAVERVQREIGKLLVGPYHERGLHTLVLSSLFTCLPNNLRTEKTISTSLSWNLNSILTEEGRWGAFFLRLYGCEAETKVSAWRFSNKKKTLIKKILHLILSYPEGIPWNPYDVYLMGEEALEAERVFQRFSERTSKRKLAYIRECLHSLPITQRRDMRINGQDIIAQFPEIKKTTIGKMLIFAEKSVVRKEVNNHKTDILRFLKENYYDEK